MKLAQRTADACLALVLALSLGAGLYGIDYGRHWDEDKLQHVVARQVETGSWLPHWYRYPSVSSTLVLAATLPDVSQSRETRAKVVETDSFLLRARKPFLVLSTLAGLWLYLGLRRRGRPPLEGLTAGTVLALGWAATFHARWIAPDALAMTFAALALGAWLASDGDARAWRWQALGAVAAGLACGSKYPAGILLLGVLLAPFVLTAPQASRRTPWLRAALGVALFGGTYLLTTPGTLLDTQLFRAHVEIEMAHYQSGHGGYSVSGLAQHLGRALAFLALRAPSQRAWLSLGVTLLALIGAVHAARTDRRRALLWVGLPGAYVLYLGAQRVMIVRNLLIVLPFLALLCGRGAVALAEVLACGRRARWLYGALALLGLVAAADVIRAARGIARRTPASQIETVRAWLAHHPAERFAYSPRAARDLTPASSDARAARALIYVKEARYLLPANVLGRYEVPAGPYEVDLDYYPTWEGFDYLIVAPNAAADGAGIELK